MRLPPRPRVLLALLTATLLLSLAVPAAEARVPHAKPYRPGGAITLDTNLLSISGVSAWAIDEYLASATPLPPLGAAFIAAERKYGVNARFLVAAALHESGWGTSYIARVKHNLFGLNAYDRNPARYASAFATYAANIDATAKFMKDYYLSPGGRWWCGQPTLRCMQQYYSSSRAWGTSISRLANSIRYDTIKGRAIRFAAPVVAGVLHGGDRTTVRLAWTGGSIPDGVQFVATWTPIELDAAAIAAIASPAAASPAVDATGGATAGLQSASGTGSQGGSPVTTAAARSRTTASTITLKVAAPSQPGTYMLEIDMRDAGRRPLPAGEQVDIPSVETRVWGDHAITVDVEPSQDGTGATVTITNTGRDPIPAAAADTAEPTGPASADRSVVTVTASSAEASDPSPILLLATPLATDLQPGASTVFSVPGIDAATGRSSNWLTVGLTVLGDPGWLAPTSPVGGWFSDTGASFAPSPAPSSTTPPSSPPSAAATPATPAPVTPAPSVTAAQTPAAPYEGPALAPAAAQPTSSPTAAPAATPSVLPASMPVPAAALPTPAPAAHKPVTTFYGEHSSSIAYRGSWANASGSYIGGSVRWSTTPGATATLTFTGSSVSWVGPKGPTRGIALVLIDGRAVGRVNMWQGSFAAQAVLFRHSFAAVGRHTLTIRVLAAPGHPYVAIDGFVVKS